MSLRQSTLEFLESLQSVMTLLGINLPSEEQVTEFVHHIHAVLTNMPAEHKQKFLEMWHSDRDAFYVAFSNAVIGNYPFPLFENLRHHGLRLYLEHVSSSILQLLTP